MVEMVSIVGIAVSVAKSCTSDPRYYKFLGGINDVNITTFRIGRNQPTIYDILTE